MKKWVLFILILAMAQCGPKKVAEESPTPLILTPTLPVEKERQVPPKLLLLGDSLSSNTAFSHRLIEDFSKFTKNCPGTPFDFSRILSFALPSASPRHLVARTGSHRDWLCRQKKIYHNGTQEDQSGANFCVDIAKLSATEKLVKDFEPTDVVIALGTNSLAFSDDFIVEKVTDLLSQLPTEVRCFWVAPTFVSQKYESKIIKVQKALTEALDTHSLSCQLIETFAAMKKQTQCKTVLVNDGIHHTRCGSQLWADLVFDKVCELY